MQVPRNMQSCNRTTINDATKRDYMIDLHSSGAVGINSQKFCFGNALRSSVFNVLPSIVQTSGVGWIIGPSFASRSIDSVFTFFVSRFLLPCYAFSVLFIRCILFTTPIVLSFRIPTKIFCLVLSGIGKRTLLTLMADSVKFFVEIGSRFLNPARRAKFACFSLWTWLHNSDIVARRGDVKPGEFGER